MSKNLDQIILQLYARTPAPCRDYCGLTITNEDVILNIWNITYGPHVYPKRHKCTLENIKEDRYMQMEINRVFGSHVVDYVKSLSNNELKLENLSTKAFLSVLKYVAAKDILSLSQTSKILFEVMYKSRKLFKKPPTRQDLVEAEDVGWRKYIMDKLSMTPRKRVKKKTVVSESKSVNVLKDNNKVNKNSVKSEINLIGEKNLKNNTSKSAIGARTLLQVKNDLKLNNSSCTKLKSQDVPKTKSFTPSSTLAAPKKIENKTVDKKNVKIATASSVFEKNNNQKSALKKIDIKLMEWKVGAQLTRNTVRKETERRFT